MGRIVAVFLVALVLGGISSAFPVSASEIPSPKKLCEIVDPRINELSGLVSDGRQWYAINDGGTRIEVFVLGRDCSVQRVITNKTDPYDVEDLALGKDGTLWLSDAGDNRKQRDTIALHAVTPAGKETLYRFSYPDGQHDVEALILDRAGVPYFVTKDLLGESGIYRPVAPLVSPGPISLERVGSVSFKSTETPGGPIGALGSVLITGAASSADGSVIALRTYTDAYLYPVTDGDILAALQKTPVRIPLPDEKQGEAIAFEPDGTLLSASEGTGEAVRAIEKATALVSSSSPGSGQAGGSVAGAAPSSSGESSNAVPQIAIIVVIAIVALLLVRKFRSR